MVVNAYFDKEMINWKEMQKKEKNVYKYFFVLTEHQISNIELKPNVNPYGALTIKNKFGSSGKEKAYIVETTENYLISANVALYLKLEETNVTELTNIYKKDAENIIDVSGNIFKETAEIRKIISKKLESVSFVCLKIPDNLKKELEESYFNDGCPYYCGDDGYTYIARQQVAFITGPHINKESIPAEGGFLVMKEYHTSTNNLFLVKCSQVCKNYNIQVAPNNFHCAPPSPNGETYDSETMGAYILYLEDSWNYLPN